MHTKEWLKKVIILCGLRIGFETDRVDKDSTFGTDLRFASLPQAEFFDRIRGVRI